jgi:hypothetical protein
MATMNFALRRFPRWVKWAGAGTGAGIISSVDATNKVVDRAVFPEVTGVRDDYVLVEAGNQLRAPRSSELHAVITPSEIGAAIETVREHPALLRSCLPHKVSDATMNKVLRYLDDQNVVQSMRSKIAQLEAKSVLKEKLCPVCPDQFSLSLDLSWEQLKDKYPCVICQDVLAAPVVLNCTHSFCGACCSDLMESIAPADSSAAEHVSHRCPSCKTEIESLTFERNLDENLLLLVKAVPDCEAKVMWMERRAAYLSHGESRVLGVRGDKYIHTYIHTHTHIYIH